MKFSRLPPGQRKSENCSQGIRKSTNDTQITTNPIYANILLLFAKPSMWKPGFKSPKVPDSDSDIDTKRDLETSSITKLAFLFSGPKKLP